MSGPVRRRSEALLRVHALGLSLIAVATVACAETTDNTKGGAGLCNLSRPECVRVAPNAQEAAARSTVPAYKPRERAEMSRPQVVHH